MCKKGAMRVFTSKGKCKKVNGKYIEKKNCFSYKCQWALVFDYPPKNMGAIGPIIPVLAYDFKNRQIDRHTKWNSKGEISFE